MAPTWVLESASQKPAPSPQAGMELNCERREKSNPSISWDGRVSGQLSQDPEEILLASSILGSCKNSKKSKIGRGRKLIKGSEGLILSTLCMQGLSAPSPSAGR